jgi:hypothetical protein
MTDEEIDAQKMWADRTIFGFSVRGPDGRRVDPRSVLPPDHPAHGYDF